MAALAAVPAWLQIAGTVIGVASSISAGQSARKQAEFEAQQYEDNAKAADASAQRQAIEERRQARLASSRLQALAQGGNSDPTIVRLHEDIAGEGEYRALTALYEGKQQAAGYRNQSTATRYEGRSKQRAAYMDAASTVMGNASSLYDKYGKKPANTNQPKRMYG